MSERSQHRATMVAFALWSGLVAAGFFALWTYSMTPGAQAAPISEWPTASELSRPLDRPALVMVAHPRCNCTARA
jgi:hypothetical protein